MLRQQKTRSWNWQQEAISRHKTEDANMLTHRKIDFRGWNAFEISNGLIRLVAVPDIGGRIMAYDLGSYPYLYVERELEGKLFSPAENQGDGSLAAWKNYGGDKTWPSPQGWDNDEQWAGPPDGILDTGRYQLDACDADGGSATIKMTSPVGSPTGVQITRQATIHPGSTRVTLTLTFRNISRRKIRWSIWDVVQLAAEQITVDGKLTPQTECVVSAPTNPNSKFENGYYVMFGDPQNPQWTSDLAQGLFIGNYQWEIGKVGLDSRAGWAAFANKSTQHAFVARYTTEQGEEYPDNGAGVEFWTVGRGKVANLDYEQSQIYLMEVEILSPYRHIEPGQTTSFQIEWGACRCPGPILEVTEGGCVGQKLSAKRKGDFVYIRGDFGIFDEGQIRLVWIDSTGLMIDSVDIGGFSPLGAVQLDEKYAAHEGLSRVRLLVVTDNAQLFLAEADIK
jgi:hypothetical protein